MPPLCPEQRRAAAGQGLQSTTRACATSRRRNSATKAPTADRFALWFWVYEHGF